MAPFARLLLPPMLRQSRFLLAQRAISVGEYSFLVVWTICSSFLWPANLTPVVFFYRPYCQLRHHCCVAVLLLGWIASWTAISLVHSGKQIWIKGFMTLRNNVKRLFIRLPLGCCNFKMFIICDTHPCFPWCNHYGEYMRFVFLPFTFWFIRYYHHPTRMISIVEMVSEALLKYRGHEMDLPCRRSMLTSSPYHLCRSSATLFSW